MKRRKFIIVSFSTLATIISSAATRVWGKSSIRQASASNSSNIQKAHLYFTAHQYALVSVLASHIVPSDDTPGATEAKVVDFIDRQVVNSSEKQKIYSDGLNKLDQYCKTNHGKNFLSLSSKQQYQILDDVYNIYYQRREKTGGFFGNVKRKAYRIWDDMFSLGHLVGFFKTLRRDTLEGFYSHPVGWKVAGYYGPPQPLGYPDYSDAPSVGKT